MAQFHVANVECQSINDGKSQLLEQAFFRDMIEGVSLQYISAQSMHQSLYVLFNELPYLQGTV